MQTNVKHINIILIIISLALVQDITEAGSAWFTLRFIKTNLTISPCFNGKTLIVDPASKCYKKHKLIDACAAVLGGQSLDTVWDLPE